ncbi:MAG: type II secretion system protein [bacterium]
MPCVHRRHAGSACRLKRSLGFTLLEIVVSMAVIGLVLGVVISRMDTMLDLEMKSSSKKLATAIRYLYNKAATEGLYIKLVLDIEENSYWVEATYDPFVISMGEGSSVAPKKDGSKKSEGEDAAEGDETEEDEEGETRIKPREPVFTQMETFLLKATKLPNSVFFKDVYVEHKPAGTSAGEEAIYFFPNGYVEHAIINLRDEDDETNYSLETNPINGRVSIEPEYRRMETK